MLLNCWWHHFRRKNMQLTSSCCVRFEIDPSKKSFAYLELVWPRKRRFKEITNKLIDIFLPTHALETRSSLLNRRRSRRPLHWLHWWWLFLQTRKLPAKNNTARLPFNRSSEKDTLFWNCVKWRMMSEKRENDILTWKNNQRRASRLTHRCRWHATTVQVKTDT